MHVVVVRVVVRQVVEVDVEHILLVEGVLELQVDQRAAVLVGVIGRRAGRQTGHGRTEEFAAVVAHQAHHEAVVDEGEAGVKRVRREQGEAAGAAGGRAVVTVRLQVGVVGEEAEAAPDAGQHRVLLAVVELEALDPGAAHVLVPRELPARVVAGVAVVRALGHDRADRAEVIADVLVETTGRDLADPPQEVREGELVVVGSVGL